MPTYRKTPEAVSKLTPEQYRVTQIDGTERPFVNEYGDNNEPGLCVPSTRIPEECLESTDSLRPDMLLRGARKCCWQCEGGPRRRCGKRQKAALESPCSRFSRP